jgi:hypothetical protein
MAPSKTNQVPPGTIEIQSNMSASQSLLDQVSLLKWLTSAVILAGQAQILVQYWRERFRGAHAPSHVAAGAPAGRIPVFYLTQTDPFSVSVALPGLEMKRLIRQLPGKLFVKNT